MRRLFTVTGLWLALMGPNQVLAQAVEPSYQKVLEFPPRITKAFSSRGFGASDYAIFAAPVPAASVKRPLAYGYQAKALMNPASVAKVFTTGMAIDRFGANYRFKTGFHADKDPVDGVLQGPLYVKGGGDPAMQVSDLWFSLRQLRARGVKTLRGPIVLDDSAFKDVPGFQDSSDSEAFDESPHRAYHAKPNALLLNYGAMALTLRINQNSVQILPDEAPANWAFISDVRLTSGGCDGWKNGMGVDYAKKDGNVVVRVSGSYPRSCGESTLPVRVPVQDWLLESWIREIWMQLGGEFSGSVIKGVTPSSTIALFTFQSLPLGDLIKRVNKWSNNVMARHLELSLAKSSSTPFGDYVLLWLKELGVQSAGDWHLENGSGLSRQSRVHAQGTVDYLNAFSLRADFPEFLASLPRASADGTLARHMKKVDGFAYLKTGSLNGVRAVAGYVHAMDGQWWSVAIYVRGSKAAESWAAMESVIDFLYRPTGSCCERPE